MIPIHPPNLEKKIKKDEQAEMVIPIHPPNFVGGVPIKLCLLANCYQKGSHKWHRHHHLCVQRYPNLSVPPENTPSLLVAHRNTHIPKELTEILQPGVENTWSPLPPLPVPKADKTADSLTEVETPVAMKKSTSFSVKEAMPMACRILPAAFK